MEFTISGQAVFEECSHKMRRYYRISWGGLRYSDNETNKLSKT